MRISAIRLSDELFTLSAAVLALSRSFVAFLNWLSSLFTSLVIYARHDF